MIPAAPCSPVPPAELAVRRIQGDEGRTPPLPAVLFELSVQRARRPFASGTDPLGLLEAGKLTAGCYLSLWGLPELPGRGHRRRAIVVGASTTYAAVMRSEALQSECPLRCRAAAETGGARRDRPVDPPVARPRRLAAGLAQGRPAISHVSGVRILPPSRSTVSPRYRYPSRHSRTMKNAAQSLRPSLISAV